MILAFAGGAIAFTGYCWAQGYSLSFTQIWSPVSYYTGTWPPGKAPDTVIIPNGTTGSGGTSGGGQSTEGSILGDISAGISADPGSLIP